ncbi:MAG: hypothetical protein Tp1109DCM542121_21 [Prokaryotic dsDNA virus sp.]|nr:MAG: hypothetical protein Tp1109DCM542121_21 [Prokaryotic dsDNA virus sp.]|tara:strand:+ start:14362 stop:14727 length:366 start_codon:yes stop_codon:yes gene_type:complete
MLGNILGAVTGIGKTYLEGRQKKSELKHRLEEAKVAAQVKKLEQDGGWEEKAMDASADSWKDEAWTICFIGIIVASFVPAAQPYMQSGFDFLRTAPEWIQWGILASIGASFGLKSIGKLKN